MRSRSCVRTHLHTVCRSRTSLGTSFRVGSVWRTGEVTPMSEPNSSVLSRDGRLARTFVALADTMVADFDVIDLLDRLVVAAVDVLDATAAGVFLQRQKGHPYGGGIVGG